MISTHSFRILRKISSNFVVNNIVHNVSSCDKTNLLSKSLPKKLPIAGVENVILVSSAKGGVGKSTVAVNVALALQKLTPTNDIGLMDADVFGPSVPHLMRLEGITPQIDSKKLIVPLQNYGIKTMSFGCLVKNDSAIVWRGLMVMSAIQQLLRQVSWGPLDTLVIDTPPGTGDVLLSLCQNIPIQGVVIVTTSHPLSLADTRRGMDMMRKLNIPLIGVVENMSHFVCPHCEQPSDLWRGTKSTNSEIDSVSSGTDKLASDYGIPLLTHLPLSPLNCHGVVASHPVLVSNPESSVASQYIELGRKIEQFLEASKTKTCRA